MHCKLDNYVCPNCAKDVRDIVIAPGLPADPDRRAWIVECSAGRQDTDDKNCCGNEEPSFGEKVGHYAIAMARWTAAGFPTRTDEEVRQIFAICRACPRYVEIDDSSGTCQVCGCHLSMTGSATNNKLKVTTEHCPDNPMRW
jgi:hypothetical protein